MHSGVSVFVLERDVGCLWAVYITKHSGVIANLQVALYVARLYKTPVTHIAVGICLVVRVRVLLKCYFSTNLFSSDPCVTFWRVARWTIA